MLRRLSRLSPFVLALVVALMPLASAAAQQEPTANDGQHLSDQPPEIQALFLAQWGQSAASEWVSERNAQIARDAVPQPAPQTPGVAGPQVTITDPTTSQNVSTSTDFIIRGAASDPSAGPKAIDRVEVWLNGRWHTPGAVQVGIATLDGGGGWSLTFSPTKFPSINSNLYAYAHSTFSGNTSVAIVNFNIVDRK
jgi:Bacterial Ig domain